jgi:anti-sigma factor RsiW
MISEHPADIILLDYVEGSLRPDESDSVRRHIASCRACRRTLAEISNTVSELERLPTADLARDHEGRRLELRRHLRTAARLAPLLIAVTALLCTLLIIRPDSTGGSRNAARRTAGPADGSTTTLRWFHYVTLQKGGSREFRQLVHDAGARYVAPLDERQAYVAIAPNRDVFRRLVQQLNPRVLSVRGPGSIPVDVVLDAEAATVRPPQVLDGTGA